MINYFLKTQKLGLSIWNEADFDKALELWGNPNVTKFITATGNMSRDEVSQRLNKEITTYKTYKVQYWPVYLLETNEFVGCCGLRPYNLDDNIYEIGIHLKEEFWGQGFAKEICRKVIEYAFDELKVSALFAGHNPNNFKSPQLLKSLGFIYTHDEFYPPTGLNHPSYILKNN